LLVVSLGACAERTAPAPAASGAAARPSDSPSAPTASVLPEPGGPPTSSATASASSPVPAPRRRPVAELVAAAAAEPRSYVGKKFTLEGVVVGPVKERVHNDHGEHPIIHDYDVPVADSVDDVEHAILCEVLHDHPARLDPGARVTITGEGSDRDYVLPRALPFYLSACRITRRSVTGAE
jgi:hypothetical protein